MSDEVKQEEEVEQAVCAVCGHDANVEEMVPDEGEVKEYVRCVLGGQPFTKEYKVFNNTLNIKFRALTSKQSDQLNALLSQLFRDKSDAETARLLDKAAKYKLAFYLAAMGGDVYEPPSPDLNLETLNTFYEERLGNTNSSMIDLLVNVLVKFVRLQKTLVETGLDQDFWKGAGVH